MIERETRKRKENKERHPKKKCSKMFIRFAQGKGINTLPPPSSVGTFHTIPPKMDSFSRSASLIKKKNQVTKVHFP